MCGETGYQIGRIFCIGMNYREHLVEMGSRIPDEPVVFMKPATSIVSNQTPIPFPSHGRDLNYETEFVFLIGKEGRPRDEADALNYIKGFTVGLDLTLRDLQARLRSSGSPWEICKSFDNSACIGDFIPCRSGMDLNNLHFACRINGELRQSGRSADMIFAPARQCYYLGTIWRLREGDIIFSGTPSGIGSLNRGDRIEITCDGGGIFNWSMEQ
jgi:2-keto-4-pentenoate hydratase/2-oxohepta-3-ene-1,7-dioic acid hydratase in catechol pathway